MFWDMKRLNFALLALAFFVVLNSFSQKNIYFDYSYKPDKDYFKTYLTASKKIATAPLKWNSKQWIIAGSVAVGGVFLYTFDEEIRQFFEQNRNDRVDFVSTYFFEPWGNIYPVVLVSGFYIYGLAAKDLRSRQIALGATQALVMSALTAQIVKHLTHRHRPNNDEPPNPRLWEGPFKGFEYTSFPSGHTTYAFSLASFLSSVYKHKPWVGILAYGIASGVGLQRLNDQVHWSSDVFIGAALGIAIGKTVYSIMNKNSKLSMGLSDIGGISLVYRLD